MSPGEPLMMKNADEILYMRGPVSDMQEQSSFSNLSVTSPTSQLILQPFHRFTYVIAHSPTLPSLYPRHSSFSNHSVTSPTSQLILQRFRCFTYVTVHSPTLLSLLSSAHSPTLPSLHLRHSSFSNFSVALFTSQLILQPFRRFTYVTAHSPTVPLLHQHHSSFSNPSFVSPTSQGLHLRHWRAAPVMNIVLSFFVLAQGKYLRPFLYLQWHSRKQQILPNPPLLPSNIFTGRFS